MPRKSKPESPAPRPPGRAKQVLLDPRSNSIPFQIEQVTRRKQHFTPERTNYFSVYRIEQGTGFFWADVARHPFEPGQLLFFLPYQYCRFELEEPFAATRMRFHANFLCVETFHAETGCSGVLFNNHYRRPTVTPDDSSTKDIDELIQRMLREQSEQKLASQEALLACMKLLLIVASRLKTGTPVHSPAEDRQFRDPVLMQLRELIEAHYQSIHSPAEYAALLHMTPKNLGRLVRDSFGKTLTDLIRERVLTHAKWQILHTLRPIKEIAAEVGYQDELYFSRVFKSATGVSPKFFREFETEIRNGSNLSMSSG